MNFTIIRDTINETFTTEIKFASFGDSGISSVDEQTLISEFPIILDYTQITFSGKYKFTAGNIVADTNGLLITSSPIAKKIPVDSTLDLTYSYNVNQILASEVDGTNILSKEQACEAHLLNFETAIIAQITTLINSAKAKQDNFLYPSIQNITI
jgi:hypothetical protein